MGNTLILFGIILIGVGLLVNIVGKLGIPLLPGDILIQKEHTTIYFPIVTSLIISVILSILFTIFK